MTAADRHDVHPHQFLRAVLTDPRVREVLAELGADPDEVLLTLDAAWLAAADTIGIEEIEAVGIDLATVLTAINPPYDDPPDWGGRRVTPAGRDVLVRALAHRGLSRTSPVGAGHLLLALMGSRDHLVMTTLRAHGLHGRAARGLVERRYRRA